MVALLTPFALMGACYLAFYLANKGKCFSLPLEPPPRYEEVRDALILTSRPGSSIPQWTPDGKRIVFVELGGDALVGRVHIVASDGSSFLALERGEGLDISHSPSISPDGSRIAYSSYKGLEDGPIFFEIETAALDGSDRRRLTKGSGSRWDFSPMWSPSGDRIAFLRHDDFDKCKVPRGGGLYTMAPDGSDVRRVGPWTLLPLSNAWAPDGESLALLFQRPGSDTDESFFRQTHLEMINVDGSDRTVLLAGKKRFREKRSGDIEPSEFLGSPVWSPDGRRIAFLKLDDDSHLKLYTIGRDGSDLREVTDTGLDLTYISEARSTRRRSLGYSREPHFGTISWPDDGSEPRFVGNTVLDRALSPDGLRVAVAIENAHPKSVPGSEVALYTSALHGSDVRVLLIRWHDDRLEAVGPEQRPSTNAASCSDGVVVPDPESNPSLVRDCQTLVAIMDGIAVVGLNWDADTPIAEWEGVSLDASILGEDGTASGEPPSPSLRVRELSLQDHGLLGSFPIRVTDLTGLWSLDLSDNVLVGEIPPELGRLAELRVLDLAGNNLSGSIPPELGQLANLQEINLPGNLDSAIPPELGRLASLEVLTLWGVLIGPIPPELGRLTKLRELTLRGHLDGPIPPELGNLSSLKKLDLHQNELSGPIPPELGNLTELEWLFLSGNKLSGPVPPELGNLTSLRRLHLDRNELSGSIPPELGNLSDLERLSLRTNKLSGPMPPELGNLTSLRRLNLNQNELSGPIPSELGNLTDLESLDLDQNLSGCIPLGLPATYGFDPCAR